MLRTLPSVGLITWLCISFLFACGQDSTKVATSARQIMMRAGKCALITIDESGFARSRTMDPFPPEQDFTVWLATNPRSRKVEQLRRYPKVTLYYSDGDNGYVSLYGMARLVTDRVDKNLRWKEEWKDFYPDRNESYLLIQVKPLRIEVIDYKAGISGHPQTWEPAAITFSNQ